MEQLIDARGKACPMPVIMAKKEADKGNAAFTVLVDNRAAVENLTRFGKNNGYNTAIDGKESDYTVAFVKEDSNDSPCDLTGNSETWAVFAGREGIGDGDLELGSSLLKMFFYTLAEEHNIPRYILFMNSGVKAAANNKQVAEQLKILAEKGSEILVCGTCLNFYNLTDQLQIGTVSNMYDIVSAMKAVNKVITL